MGYEILSSLNKEMEMNKQAAYRLAVANARRLDAMGKHNEAMIYHREAARIEQQIRSM